MVWRSLVIMLFCLATSQAHARENFTCQGRLCWCDGSYLDCKAMERVCKGGIVNCNPAPCRCTIKFTQPAPKSPRGAPR
jgi:hypothetical protein